MIDGVVHLMNPTHSPSPAPPSRLWQGGMLCSLATSTLIKRLKASKQDEKEDD
jgi:hypothetical protein